MQITGEVDLPIAKEIYAAPDRSAAILATSWLDEYLTVAIKTKLLDDKDTANKLLKPSGPLGNLVPKAELGYLLKLYGKETRDDLIHIAGIRNMFAHWTKTVDFGSRDIRQKCESLTLFDRIWSAHSEYEKTMKKSKPFSSEISRTRFLDTIGLAVNMLNWEVTIPVLNAHDKW
jgi:hypothetical protein